MKFEVVKASTNQGVMSTTSDVCIPWNLLDVLSADGYKFKVDGKVTAKQKVKEAVKASLKSQGKTLSQPKAIPQEPVAQTPDKVSYLIFCYENGKTYNKQSEAAKDLHIDPAAVSDSIKTGKTRSGYTFEKVIKTND